MSKNAVMPLTDYANACNKIREKTGSKDLIKSGEFADKIDDVYSAGQSAGGGGSYDEGFEAGKKSQYDEFWDAYQEYGNRSLYLEAFVRGGWNDTTYNPKYDIIGQTYGLRSLFSSSSVTDTKVNLIVRVAGDLRATFNACIRLVRIPSLVLEVPITDMVNTFTNCKNLEEINVSCVNDGCFATNFDMSASTKLTHDSLMSIIRALKDFATKQTVYVSAFTDFTDAPFDIYTINEGETYFLTFKPNGVQANIFEDMPAVVKPMGNTIGAHYETDYWADDNFTYNVDLYKGNIDDSTGEYYFCERRYIKDKATGDIELLGVDGDEMTIKKRGTVTETRTLIIGATNIAKLSDADKLQATEKGWTIV